MDWSGALRVLLSGGLAALAAGCPNQPAGTREPSAAAPPGVEAPGRQDPRFEIRGGIPQLQLSRTNAYAYRDWMPRVREPGPDGGTPLIYMVGFTLANTGSEPLRLRYSAELHVPGADSRPVELADMNEGRRWPLDLAPGASLQLLMGARDGPYLPVGSEIGVTLEIRSEDGAQVTLEVSGLLIEKTA